jgi:hypothetical protein
LGERIPKLSALIPIASDSLQGGFFALHERPGKHTMWKEQRVLTDLWLTILANCCDNGE